MVHETDCKSNYTGTSGGMEVYGLRNIFCRSKSKYNVRYLNYLGDGDSKGFEVVSQEKVYGDEVIERLECIGHVQKRMGTRLRALKSKRGKTKLSDGKTISGKGRLTDSSILKLQKYYGLAIRRNTKMNVRCMQKEIWAGFFHVGSSNKSPVHGLCPKGESSWCKYQRAIANKETYDHSKHFHLPQPIMLEIKPVYRDPASPRLLLKCLHGKSQNPNESFNNVIWSKIPKNNFVQLDTLKLGVYDAVTAFNIRNLGKCLVLKKLGLPVGKNSVEVLKKHDMVRIRKAEKMVAELEKKARQQRAFRKRKLEELYVEEEDPDNPSYASGHY